MILEYTFYLLVFVYLLFELFIIFNVKSIHKSMNRYRVTLRTVIKEGKRMWLDEVGATAAIYIVLNVFYIAFSIIGLFSSQWLLFVMIMAVWFIPNRTRRSRIVEAGIIAIILVGILANKFYFGFDFSEHIFNIYK